MLFQNKLFRNIIVGTLVVLFGFTAVSNIFMNQKSIKIDQFSIKIVDIANLGGFRESKDNRYYQNAIRTMILFKILSKEAKSLGIVIDDSDVKDYLKKLFATNGQFDAKKMNDFMNESKISKDGLRTMAELELLKTHLTGVIDLGMPSLSKHTHLLLENVNLNRSGYYAKIDPDSIDVKKYGAPQDDDLFEFLVNNQELIDGQNCEIIKIGQDDNQYSIDELRDKFTIINSPIVKGIIMGSTQISVEDVEIDSQTYLSEPFLTSNGERIQIKFKELFGLNKNDVEKAWYKSDGAKARACFTLIDLAKRELKQNPDKIINNLTNVINFVRVDNITFSDCFQKRCKMCPANGKCAKCMCNDCVCKQCFNKDNKNKLNRAAAMIMLFSPLKQLGVYKGEEGYYLAYPTEETKSVKNGADMKSAEEYMNHIFKRAAERLFLEEIILRSNIKI